MKFWKRPAIELTLNKFKNKTQAEQIYFIFGVLVNYGNYIRSLPFKWNLSTWKLELVTQQHFWIQYLLIRGFFLVSSSIIVGRLALLEYGKQLSPRNSAHVLHVFFVQSIVPVSEFSLLFVLRNYREIRCWSNASTVFLSAIESKYSS